MSTALLLIPIFLPIICGFSLLGIRFPSDRIRNGYVLTVVLVTSVITGVMLFTVSGELFTLMSFTGDLTLAIKLDGMGRIFAGLVALLWPFTAVYAFEYMKHEHHQKMFYAFFLVSYGVTVGIAASGNILTMYFFYELLTLSTLPLVIQPMTTGSRRAGRYYLLYSIGGAAFAFIGMVFLLSYGSGAEFVMGGILGDEAWQHRTLMLIVYVGAFMGFGVKAAIFPLHSWLPKASVAPTPVTALLHAVAVVKAGAFACIRLTYYCFGTDFVKNSWAQYAVMSVAMISILYGSSAALKQVHFKRRLAYSTMANLSYILFGVTLMTPAGLEAGVLHLLFHSIIKIGAFFAAGAVLHNTGREFVSELDGMGKRMPVTFGAFVIFALSLTGVPLFNGFVSKWSLASAAVESGGTFELMGIIVLLISALLTAIYMLNVCIRAYFPGEKTDLKALAKVREASDAMTIPMAILAGGCIFFGVNAQPLMDLISKLLY